MQILPKSWAVGIRKAITRKKKQNFSQLENQPTDIPRSNKELETVIDPFIDRSRFLEWWFHKTKKFEYEKTHPQHFEPRRGRIITVETLNADALPILFSA